MAGVSIRAHRVRALFTLLGEARELAEADHDPSEHLASSTLHLLGADAGGLVSGRMPMRLGDNLLRLVSAGFSSSAASEADAFYTAQNGAAVDPAAVATMARSPATVVGRRCDLVDDRSWYASEFVNEHRRAWRLDDSIYSTAFREESMHGMGYFRAWGGRPFSEEDRELARLLVEETLALLPSAGKPSRLSPRERETRRHLLTGASTKEIAARLGLSVHTVNEYVQGVYRAENVHSRGELLAKHRRARP